MIAGLSVAILGATLYALHLKHFEAAITHGQTRSVLVARRTFGKGSGVLRNGLQILRVPARFTDDRHVHAGELGRVVGVPASREISPGSWLTWDDVDAADRDYNSLSEQIASGARMLGVAVRSDHLGALVRPGDRGDIIISAIQPNTENRLITTTLLQDVRIASVGRQFLADDGSAAGSEIRQNLTLEVTLQGAIGLVHAMRFTDGRVFLAIRQGDDHAIHAPVVTTDLTVLEADQRNRLQYNRVRDGSPAAPAPTPAE